MLVFYYNMAQGIFLRVRYVIIAVLLRSIVIVPFLCTNDSYLPFVIVIITDSRDITVSGVVSNVSMTPAIERLCISSWLIAMTLPIVSKVSIISRIRCLILRIVTVHR